MQLALLTRSWSDHDLQHVCAADGHALLSMGIRHWLALTGAAGAAPWSAMAASRVVQDAALMLLSRTIDAVDAKVVDGVCSSRRACDIHHLPPVTRRAIARKRSVQTGGASSVAVSVDDSPAACCTDHRRGAEKGVEHARKRAKVTMPLRSISVENAVHQLL